jgi:hypothetical protein
MISMVDDYGANNIMVIGEEDERNGEWMSHRISFDRQNIAEQKNVYLFSLSLCVQITIRDYQ